ncbi:MAG TPA: ABC transporter permease [Cyclobacteriaceae bacterium]|nr:ABC transporter permease [Cyclobacteriaceae bacterium]
MFKNFLIISIRNLNRNKVFSVINIFGLAIGMAACLAIAQYVHFEMSYDRFHKNADHIYRVLLADIKKTHASNHPGTGPMLKDEFPEVKDYARMVHQTIFYRAVSTWSHIDEYDQIKTFNIQNVYNVDPSFVTMFSFPFLYGNPETAFTDLNSVVISRSVSQKFFGSENPVGKILIRDGYRSFTVTGVIDVLENSHMKFDMLLSYFFTEAWGGGWSHTVDWKWPEYFTYIQLDPAADPKYLEAKFQDVIPKYLGDWMKAINRQAYFRLQPIKDIHLKSPLLNKEYVVHGSVNTVNFLSIIAVIILVVAWFNYINLSTARSIERAREVGFRKVAGASKKQLIIQFLLESVILNIPAILLAFIIFIISVPWFNDLAGLKIGFSGLYNETWFWISLGIIFMLGSLLAGIYPAFVLSSIRIITVIKGKYSNSAGGIMFRKLLVGGQFAISIALIAGTLIVYRQVSFMRNKDLGYNKEQMLVVKVPTVVDSTFASRAESFLNELENYSGQKKFTVASEVPGKWIPNVNSVKKEGSEEIEIFGCSYVSIDHNFIDTYEMKAVAGRNFRVNEYSKLIPGKIIPVMINEKAAEILGFKNPEESISEHILFTVGDLEWTGEIIGVVNNYHQRSFRMDYDPMVFGYYTWGIQYICINLNTGNLIESVAYIKDLYKSSFPGNPFEYFFQDDYFDMQYASDKQFGKVFGLFSLLAIIVASLGLFGLTTYIILKRTKEIAIRKILGASIQGLVILFSKDFIRLIVIANLLALPITYIFVNNWLNNFKFKININWIMFVLPMIVLLIIALVTTSIQTIRSSFINPANTLKYE